MIKGTIGILTMHRVRNCGSFLQAFALQHTLECMGCKTEIIDYMYPNAFHQLEVYDNPVSLHNALDGLYPNLRHRRWWALSIQWQQIKWLVMLHSKLKLSNRTYYTPEELKANPPQYDAYLLGSDQVWNERFMKCDPSFFLAFAPKEAPKMAFASSVPNTHFSELFIKSVQEYVATFKCIATREKASAQALKPYVGKEVHYVLDPVFLLSDEEWNKILGLRTKKRNYVLCFVLDYMGHVKGNVLTQLNSFLEQHRDMRVYANGDYIKYPRPTKVGDVLPKQFVKLIANASYVITDSFHATAFSLLYGVPVMPIISDKQHDIRIQDMCERLGDEDTDGFIHVNDDKLETERTRMLNYLRQMVEL